MLVTGRDSDKEGVDWVGGEGVGVVVFVCGGEWRGGGVGCGGWCGVGRGGRGRGLTRFACGGGGGEKSRFGVWCGVLGWGGGGGRGGGGGGVG